MNKVLRTIFQQIITDRPVLILMMSVGILSLGYAVYVGFSLSPSDLQIATRYTAFGETQYYRGKWYYLLSFIVFALMVGVVHGGIMAKLKARDMRPLAIAFGWLSIILIVMFILLTHSILKIAFLS